MLPHVLRFNAVEDSVARAYAEVAYTAQVASLQDKSAAAAENLAKRLDSLLLLAGLRPTLDHFGVKPSDIPRLAEEAARQWTAQFNPRPVSIGDFHHLYSAALATA